MLKRFFYQFRTEKKIRWGSMFFDFLGKKLIKTPLDDPRLDDVIPSRKETYFYNRGDRANQEDMIKFPNQYKLSNLLVNILREEEAKYVARGAFYLSSIASALIIVLSVVVIILFK